ncbi:zinc finger protein 37-like isoform X4 [Galleria mellonella]|uniref:Zinc finger protein 37-like isoform X4 n=1 Tax=Galleria mellonella TaxID=7137 RepID=A0ABM3N0S6_GALME|nr:zinc finger protein 37-like isoform X4 [Galleria mellonella]
MATKTMEWRPGPTVCRCCLAEGCYKDISTEYFWMGKREVYAEMLSETFSVSIAYSTAGGPNSNSRLICEPCISRLRDASEFKRQVQECEKTFMQHLDPGSSSALGCDGNMVNIEPEDVKVEAVKVESRLSDDEFDDRVDFGDDDDDDLDDEPLTKFATKVPKKESVDILDLLDNSKAAEKRKSSTKIKATPAKKTKKEAPKPTSSKPKPEKKKKGIIQETDSTIILKDEDGADIKLTVLKTPIPLDTLPYEKEKKKLKKYSLKTKVRVKRKIKLEERRTKMMMLQEPISLDGITEQSNAVTVNIKTVQGLYKYSHRTSKNKQFDVWKQNALTIFENSHVYPFVHSGNKYKCFVCAKPFLDAALLKEHSINDHSAKELKLELNNRVRDKNLKVDVSNIQCKLCLEILPNIEALKEHLKKHGKSVDLSFKDNLIPFKLDAKTFDCQICGESFLKLRLLIIHMSKHYNNYSCDMCGSVFISLHLLRRHLQIHKSGNFPCDKCNKIFSNPAKRTIHMRGVHLKQWPRRCPMCPERFNSNYQRTKHLRMIHNQTTGLYRCETCGREYYLKYHLLIHIRSVHLQERNQECSICHSRFFSKYCLSRHMVIHSGEKKFLCGVCGKGYVRKKNLKDHMRQHEIGFICSICGQNYVDQASLFAHVNVSHGAL